MHPKVRWAARKNFWTATFGSKWAVRGPTKTNIGAAASFCDAVPRNAKTQQESTAKHWNPFWLHKSFLLASAAAFMTLVAALLFLMLLSKRGNGIALHTTNHFTWTYGPTALLTIFVAGWRQIDFYCKVLIPWAELSRDGAHPSRSVLLDYTSCLQVVSFLKAVKNKHIVVVTTIAGFVILKLATLASTGLFFPQSVKLAPHQVSLRGITRLDGALYNVSENPGLFDPSIAYTAYAVMAKGLSYADGTTAEMVYERMKLADDFGASNTTITTTVTALLPSFRCQSAPVSILLQPANVTDPHPEDTLELQFPECTLRNGGDGTSVYALNPQNTVCPDRQLSPLLQQIDCVKQTTSNQPENWQLLTLADFRYQQNFTNDTAVTLGDTIAATSWATGVQRVTGIACLAGFSVQRAQISYDFNSQPPTLRAEILAGRNDSQLDSFRAYDLGVLTTSALMASADMFGNLVDNQAALEYPNVLFKMMAAVSGGTYEDLFDETTMIAAAQNVFQQVAIQAVGKYLVRNEDSPLTGSLTTIAERLQINEVPFWLMSSGVLIMAVLACSVLFKRPTNVCSRDPETVGNIAQLVAYSSGLRDVLRGTSQAGDEELEQKLHGLTFGVQDLAYAGDHGICKIDVATAASRREEDHEDTTRDETQPEIPLTWWSPLTIKRWVLAITVLLPLAFCIVLEVLQRVSDTHHGFVVVTGLSDAFITIYTRFVPALLMLLIATLVNALDFNVAVLTPYNALSAVRNQGRVSGMFTSILGTPPPFALWQSFNQRSWGAFISGFAALVGSVLTIVVSGLYTIDTIAVSESAILNHLDHFNTSWLDSVKNDSSAAVVTSLTESLGLDYPQFTYGELALPALLSNQVHLASNTSALGQALVEVELPALRADLVCLQLPPGSVNVSASFDNRIQTANAFVSATAQLPASCPFSGSNGNSSNIQVRSTFTLLSNSSFVGKLLDIHVGPFDSVTSSSSGELSPNTQADNPLDCPSLAFIYGYADVNDQSRTSVTALMCYQYIDQIQTNVTFTLPELIISTNQSLPSVDESSARRLPSGLRGETAFQFRPQLHMDDEFSSFNVSAQNTTTAGTTQPLDNFFHGVLYGREPLDPSLLAGNDESDVTNVYLGIRGLYRRYMAQAISSNMRVPFSSSSSSSAESKDADQTTTGNLVNTNFQQRIVQNNTAKLILQVQLCLIFVLTSIAVYLTKLHEILPYNPRCIAGVAALFARSRMCDLDHPIGKEIMENDGQGLTNERWRFRLGWWDITQEQATAREKWYGIDAVKVDEEH
nr:hypothetical protein LTR18_005886 [Exophiala xenobiotica]